MASKVHSLRGFEHIDEDSGLKLTTNGWVTISSFNAYEFPFSYTFQDLSTLISNGTWIAGGNRLEIHLRILLDGVSLQSEDCLCLREDLGIVLCDAEIWPQLGLSASLSLPVQSDDYLASSSFELILILSSCCNDKPEQPNRLSSTTPMNTKPPTGVPCACLEKLRLRLKLSCFHTNELNPLKQISCRGSMEEAAAPPALLEIDNAEEILDEHVVSTPPPPRIPRHIGHHVAFQLEYYRMLEDEHANAGSSSDSLSSLFSSNVNSQNNLSSQSSLNQSTHKPESACGRKAKQKLHYHQIKFADIVRLVDLSLRAVIFESKTPTSARIDRSDTTGHPKLSLISPTLFVPGYLEAVSQRRNLISTLSNCLSGVYRRTTSPSLRRKLELLMDIPPERYMATGIPRYKGPHINVHALTAAIEARLWFLTQRKLLDFSACNKLKPLAASTRSYASFESLQMLEEDSQAGIGKGVDSSVHTHGPGELCGDRVIQTGQRLDPVDILFDEEEVESDCMEKDLLWEDVPVGEDTSSDEDLFWDHLRLDDDPLYSLGPSSFHVLQDQATNDTGHELLDIVDVPHADSDIADYGCSMPRPLNDLLSQRRNSQDEEMLLT